MNQEKIGKFIARCRKEKGLTQQELAEKLGVTDRSVSKWENGRCLPDLSLFNLLCQELGITINELLSGEKINKGHYQEKLEENIVRAIDYSTKRVAKYSYIISLILIIFGLFVAISAIMIFPSESSWGSIYSVLGIIIFIIGIGKMVKSIRWYKRLIIILGIFMMAMGILLFMDYVNVRLNEEAPMFRRITTTTGNVIYYDTLFYDVYRCNFDTEKEYWVITKNSKPSIKELLNYCK